MLSLSFSVCDKRSSGTVAKRPYLGYGKTGCGVFSSGGYKIRKIFWIRINIPKGSYWILSFGLMVSWQKSGLILVIKWFKNWWYKNVSNKKFAPKLDSSMKKINKKDSNEFLLLKVKLWHILTPFQYTNSQNVIFFEYVDF